MKLLFVLTEIIRNRDIGLKRFLNNLNHFYYEYMEDIPNGPKPTLKQFNDYLYKWAEKVWPRALDVIMNILETNMLRDNSLLNVFLFTFSSEAWPSS